MADHPTCVREAQALAERVLAEDVTSGPSADDVRALMRRQNWMLGAVSLLLVLLGAATVWYSANSSSASQASRESTQVQLAQARRSACLTERRNAELAAVGDTLAALGRGQIAALIDADSDETARQRQLFEEADRRRQAAAQSLTPDVLTSPPPTGCGPPVTLDDT